MAKLTKALKDSKGNIGKTENEKNSGKEQFLKKDDKGNILKNLITEKASLLNILKKSDKDSKDKKIEERFLKGLAKIQDLRERKTIENIESTKKSEVKQEQEEIKRKELSTIIETSGIEQEGKKLNENQDGQVYSSLNKSYGLYLNKPDDYSSGFKVNISSTSEINKGVERNLREDINVKKLEDVYQTKKQEQDFSFAKGEARAQVKEFGSKDEENLINDPNIKRLKDGYQTQRAKK